MTGLVTAVKMLREIDWRWTKATIKQVASDLGLVNPTAGSDRWIGYQSPSRTFPAPDPEFPCEFIDHPYGFSFRGQEVSQFHIWLAAVDMGEVHLNQSDRYQEVYERKHAEFKGAFQKAVKQITTVLAEPIFQGGPNDQGIKEAHPVGWGGKRIAVWRLNNARLILRYGQEDKELPIALELYVCPPLQDSENASETLT